jgi:SET domain-containing protein
MQAAINLPETNELRMELGVRMPENWPGLEVFQTSQMGLGVRANRDFPPDSIMCDYKGERIQDPKQIQMRNTLLNKACLQNPSAMWYQYEVTVRSKRILIDSAGKEFEGTLGRLINHSRKKPNIKPHIWQGSASTVWHLVFRSVGPIRAGEELFFDYLETDPERIKENPWLSE